KAFSKPQRVTSELYKSEIYQITKMIGNSVLQANVHLFSGLKIIPLATLDDSDLILSIVRKAENGLKPTVDQLKYNFISYEAVADYVFLLLFDFSINNLPSFYIEKNLYAEVAKVVGSQKIELGRVVDRILVKDGVFCATPELLSLLSC
ncbi:MAG: hypothetical protein NWQ54_03050, partial [Paraglaciecola sp.]|nr:hypothetical protein [Paraglaciecola sp.]